MRQEKIHFQGAKPNLCPKDGAVLIGIATKWRRALWGKTGLFGLGSAIKTVTEGKVHSSLTSFVLNRTRDIRQLIIMTTFGNRTELSLTLTTHCGFPAAHTYPLSDLYRHP